MLHAVVGHLATREALARAFGAGTLPDGLLMHGIRGVGKQRMALWLGQLAVCEAPGVDGPCDECRSCRMALRLEHPDIHWFFPLERPKKVSADRLGEALEDARASRLAEIREDALRPSAGGIAEATGIYLAAAQTLRRMAHKRPAMAATQTFIIADAERLVPQESSQEAANALLKLIEEPPEDTRFVLTTSEPGSVLDTIRSRTVPLHVTPLADDLVTSFLEEHRDATADRVRQAARLAQGSIGRALGFLPDEESEAGPLKDLHDLAFDVVAAALDPAGNAGPALALRFRSWKARALLDLLSFVEAWVRDLAAVAAGVPQRARGSERLDELSEMVRAAALHPTALTGALAAIDEAALQARGNVNPQLILAGLVIGLRRRLRPCETRR